MLAIATRITPTPTEIVRRLGATSPAHDLDALELQALYEANRDMPEVRLKRQLWARLLTTALGTAFEDEDALFAEHTLLVASAEIIAHSVVGINPADPTIAARTLLEGGLFANAQVAGVVEGDFFDWVADVPGGDRFIRTLARRLSRFAWQSVEHDVMKVLYESVIGADTRHSLGEYYTPDGALLRDGAPRAIGGHTRRQRRAITITSRCGCRGTVASPTTNESVGLGLVTEVRGHLWHDAVGMSREITASTDVDERNIRHVVRRAQELQSDPTSLMALHVPTAVVVNFPGRRVLGRDALREAMTAALASPLSSVRTSVEIIDVRFVTSDVAVVSCTKTIHDGRSADDMEAAALPSSAGALTYVVVRTDDAWRIALAQTTPIAESAP